MTFLFMWSERCFLFFNWICTYYIGKFLWLKSHRSKKVYCKVWQFPCSSHPAVHSGDSSATVSHVYFQRHHAHRQIRLTTPFPFPDTNGSMLHTYFYIFFLLTYTLDFTLPKVPKIFNGCRTFHCRNTPAPTDWHLCCSVFCCYKWCYNE